MSSSIAAALLRRALRRSLPAAAVLRRSLPAAAVLRRPFSSASLAAPPLALRPILAGGVARASSLLPRRFGSSSAEKVSERAADEKLIRVLDSEIECAQQDQTLEVTLPDEFPFEIIDNAGDQTITLKREFEGETIEATVFVNNEDADAEDEEINSGDDDNEKSIQPSISLVVTIDKGESTLVEVCCTLGAAEDLTIESFRTKNRDDPDNEDAYQGPEFSELDESLQKALYSYLESRGIKTSLFDFLNDYMLNKDEREYLTWLENMKKFVKA